MSLEGGGGRLGSVVAGLAQRVAEPFETLVETVTGGGAGGLDVPGALPQAVQTQLVRNLGRVHRVRQILLVGEDQQERISQLVLVQHALQLLEGLNVEANRRNRGDDLTQLELVQDGGLSGSVESDHQNTHLLLAPQAVEQLGERETHLGGGVSVLSEG